MKKNDVILLVSALLFSGLFYRQYPGVNYTLFTMLLSTAILLFNPQKLKDRHWWYYCVCANLAGLSVLLINSALSVFATLVSCVMLGSKAFTRNNSIFTSFFFGVFSVFTSIGYWLKDVFEHKPEKEAPRAGKGIRIAGLLTAVVIACLFLYLYRLSNPLFDELMKSIDLDWSGIQWLLFTFLGFLILHGLLKIRRIEFISQLDLKFRQNVSEIPGGGGPQRSGATIAFNLFLLLNAMLLVINSLDVSNIYITQQMPEGITLSDFVHESVRSTVFSIVIAMSLIAWFFGGNLNFDADGRKTRLLVYAWILQSALVVINTMVRNCWYIHEYQLTYLRIGVFVFLILCLIGLTLTWLKIAKHKSAWHLANANFETWFFLLIFASPVNWDKAVTNYNLNHTSASKKLDTEYLIRFSDANLPELVQLYANGSLNEEEKEQVRQKALDTYYKNRFTQWQSFSMRRQESNEAFTRLKLKPAW